MEMEGILKAIEQANAEESKILLDAIIKRRETFLNGGEVICTEYSREEVEHIEALLRRIHNMEPEEQ